MERQWQQQATSGPLIANANIQELGINIVTERGSSVFFFFLLNAERDGYAYILPLWNAFMD